MRTINLNGYIDEEVWYGDEITPSMLHDALYGENGEFSDDVRIILNSYGGSCNAAVRMHDDIRAYPGRVHLVISGTAASAATVLSAAADTLEMTPGSLYMIHDPYRRLGQRAGLRRSYRAAEGLQGEHPQHLFPAQPHRPWDAGGDDDRHHLDGRGRGAGAGLYRRCGRSADVSNRFCGSAHSESQRCRGEGAALAGTLSFQKAGKRHCTACGCTV